MVDRELKTKLRQAVTTDFSAQIEQLKQALTGKHTVGSVTTDILVTGQQPDQAHSTPQALIATILLQGTASAQGKIAIEQGGTRTMSSQEPR
jgi:hypothetical protein